MKTADLCDRFGGEVNVCHTEFRSYGKRRSFHGPIRTVKVADDNVLVLQAIETVPAGTVLVVDGGGSRNCALLGDRLAGIAASRGLAGIIIHGCVRDVSELAETDCGILAIGSMPRKSKKDGTGETDVPLHFGGVEWNPGHYVYADEDGVVVSEKELTL